MSGYNEIILFSEEQALRERISILLAKKEGVFPPVNATADINELSNRLEESNVPFVIIDYTKTSNGILNEIEPIAAGFPMTRFVMLTEDLNSELVMKSMQCGIRHVQAKSDMESEFSDILQRLMPPVITSKGEDQGRAITILSAGGGCGATTLTVNLANELQLASEQPVLLIDMDYHYGAVGTYLDLHGQYGVSDVLAHTGHIDANLIDTTAVKYSEKLHALISPASIHFQETRPIPNNHIEPVIEACKQGYGYTLIDAPRIPMDIATSLAECSAGTLIVFQACVKDVRIAKSIITSLNNRGIPLENIYPVLNRYKKRGEMVSIEEAKNALGGLKITCMANDYSSAVKGINFGKPLSKSAPRSALRKDLRDLVERITDKESVSFT